MYEALIAQLDQFIRKYYLSRILKGSLLFVAGVISLYLLMSIGEFTFYFPSWLRWILILGFLLVSVFALIAWILIPLSKYLKISNGISYEQAAQIIGQHFSEIQDKLLNILQLKSHHATLGSQELLQAGIQQKIQQIQWIPFSNAVDLGENKKFLRYTLPPLLVLLGILFIAPQILKESNARLSQPNTFFSKPAPFEFIIDTQQLNVKQFSDAEITVNVKGKVLPTKMEWKQNYQTYELTQKDANTFVYKAYNIQENTTFRLQANGFYSQEYQLHVIKKPVVSSLEMSLIYPAYTKRKNEVLQSNGDLVVPIGTRVKWKLTAKNSNKIAVRFDESLMEELNPTKNEYIFNKNILSNTNYKLYAWNSDNLEADSVLYQISVIEDQFPAIQVEQIVDSTQPKSLFFMGNASDDYGISKINCVIQVKNDKNQIIKTTHSNIRIAQETLTDFTHQFSISAFDLSAGERLEYYFVVWDNDGVNGSKSTRSNVFTYSVPTVTELKKIENSNNQDIKNSLQSTSQEVHQLSKDIQSLKEKIYSKKNLTWEDKKEAKELLDKHQELQEELKEIKKKYDENLENQELFKNTEPEILEKQELIQQMMDELLSQEMKDLMKEIEELMEKFQQNNAFEKLDNMQMSNEQLNKELDKMLELFKKLEIEQKANDISQQLEQLSQKQDQAQQKTDAKSQQEINEQFDEIKKDFEQLKKLNAEQNEHLQLEQPDKQKEEIDKSLQKAKENLENQQNQPAQNQQKNASEGMKKMAEQLRSQMMQMQMQQAQEDINTIRRILSNLIHLSKDQEDLMDKVKKTNEYDTKYTQLVQEQQNLNEESKVIEDSLTALGKRVFQLQTFISDELYKLKRDLRKSTISLEAKQKGSALSAQQYAMTSANNLALMLSEVMSQMQEQMSQMGSGGSCSKPGGSNPQPSPGELKKLQQELGQDLQKMGKQMQQGQNGTQINKDLAEMAQRQAAIREALRKLKDGMSQQQKKSSNIDQLLEDLDKNESDIAHKKIKQETLLRQKEIETRMLELENSLRNQGEKEDRTSQSGKETPLISPPQIEEFLKNRKSNLNISNNLPPELKPFYKNLVRKYRLQN